MKIQNINIKEIKPYEKNAKIHPKKQIEQVANSIKRFGWVQPLVVDKDNNLIIGHCRLLAAKLLDIKEVPTLRVENLSEQEIRALRLADNKLNESEWDMDLAIEELKELPEEIFNLTGFDKELLITDDPKDDELPEDVRKETKLGDIYEFNGHRLKCGDSTNKEDIDDLMGNDSANVVFTSPPYNMGTKMYKNYSDNLKDEEYIDFNIKVIENVKRYLKGFLFWNISYNKNTRDGFIKIIYRIIQETGLKFLELIIWNKKHGIPITSNKLLTRQYEDILLVGDENSIKEDIDMYFCGSNQQAVFNKKTMKGVSNYWEIGTNDTQLDTHKACFPVALPTKGIILMSKEGDIVLDPFMGSGSTLIAGVKTNRKVYGMELSPEYCDISIQRYVNYTGNNKIKKNGKEIIWQEDQQKKAMK